MSRVTLTVNGAPVTAEVAPRTHLADFLREERLLTGTHIGCEHGVCGACTLLLNGAPARSCIAFTVACDGADVRTIEGLEDDPVIVRLRAAFTTEHALQCGYCTPGMLVTARDIVLRLPDADEACIRLELAGNLCRCTGYAGIVHAIRRVLAEGLPATSPAAQALPALTPPPAARVAASAPAPSGPRLTEALRIAQPLERVWAAIQDPELIASCIPGARLVEAQGDNLRGEVRASLGPIETCFTGEGQLSFSQTERRAEVTGEGRDSRSGTRLSGHAMLALAEAGPHATDAMVTVAYTLRGPLAQFARGPVVQAFAAAFASSLARNLEARLAGAEVPAQRQLPMAWLLVRAVWRSVCRLFGR